jgi:hypothetical protein
MADLAEGRGKNLDAGRPIAPREKAISEPLHPRLTKGAEPSLPPHPAGDSPPAAPAADDPLLRPAWEDAPDETDADRLDRRPVSRPMGRHGADVWAQADAMRDVLAPLCDATDALARLDAGAAAAPAQVREGLVARMAYTEAAGWLACAHTWVHPLDLALRDLGLTGTYAVAATGGGARVMPQTFAGPGRTDWDFSPLDTVAEADRALAEALALARLLRRLAGARGKGSFGSAADAAASLAPFVAGPLDPDRFAAWQAGHVVPVAPSRRFGRRGEGGPPPPPLLGLAQAAQAWMAGDITAAPTALAALLAAVDLCGHNGPARTVFVPVWAAWPAVGYGARDALPGLRSDAADRLVGRGRPVAWPVAFLHLVAESARTGQRELERLAIAAEKGRKLTAHCDRRSRLPAAVDALLRIPALTPKALAARLSVAPQTATALLRELQTTGFAREVTGRGSFRAFALA